MPRPILLLLASLVASLGGVRAASASFTVLVGSTTAASGGGGTLDVTLTNTGPAAVVIGGFSFGISAAGSNIPFTSATTGTAAPYLFDGNSLFGPVISTSAPGSSLLASDLDATPAGATVGVGQTVGLGHVLFSVAAGAPAGPVAVTLTAFPTTSLATPAGADIPIDTLTGGTITVTRAAAVVPEPSALLLAGLGWPAVWLLRRRRAA